jgi:hypothetical protein
MKEKSRPRRWRRKGQVRTLLYLTISEGEDHPVLATSDRRVIRAALEALSQLDKAAARVAERPHGSARAKMKTQPQCKRQRRHDQRQRKNKVQARAEARLQSLWQAIAQAAGYAMKTGVTGQ